MTGTGKKGESGEHSEAGQKFHADAKAKGEAKPDQQSASSTKAPAPGKARAKAANGKFTKGQSPDEELGSNEVNNKKLGGSFENNGQVRHTSHDGARPGLEKGENADAD